MQSTTSSAWFVYLLECHDNSIYTGITTDVAARFACHMSGRGGRYTRSHPPKRIIYVGEYPTRSAALKAEYQIKQLSSDEKRALSLVYLGEQYGS